MTPQPGRLFFCVDGGGTRSRAKLLDRDGIVLASALSGPCNPSTDPARALASLNDLWEQCRAGDPATGLADVTLAIGAAGLYVPQTRAAFLAACPAFGRAVAMTDGYAALIGAGAGQPSALIIAGTGIAGHRLYGDGRSIQRDAWGWVAGDRGSGAWMGRKALRHCFAARDGVEPPSGLSRAVEAGWLRGLTPDRLGALAPVLLREAEAGEPVAVAIRSRAVEHLAALAVVLDATEVALYGSGGIADVLRTSLAERLGRPVLEPEADAPTGCFLVASGRAPHEQADFFGTAEQAP
jgi:glucosamine kinase